MNRRTIQTLARVLPRSNQPPQSNIHRRQARPMRIRNRQRMPHILARQRSRKPRPLLWRRRIRTTRYTRRITLQHGAEHAPYELFKKRRTQARLFGDDVCFGDYFHETYDEDVSNITNGQRG